MRLDDTGQARFFCSWSGGKDSALALYRATRELGVAASLLTMFDETGVRSRSHGLTRRLVEAQAAALGLPLVARSTSWDDYESEFRAALRELRAQGIELGVFGDIDLDPHREWVERVCGSVDVQAAEPLWKRPRRELLAEFLGLGFRATIVVVRAAVLGPEFLGRELDPDLVDELERTGIDASGEGGEYHTVVTDGPLFRGPIQLQEGGVVRRGDCWALDLKG